MQVGPPHMYIQGDFFSPANYANQEGLSPQEVSPPHSFFCDLEFCPGGFVSAAPDGSTLTEQPPDPPGLGASIASGSGGPDPPEKKWTGVLAKFQLHVLRSCAPICIYTHPYLYK